MSKLRNWGHFGQDYSLGYDALLVAANQHPRFFKPYNNEFRKVMKGVGDATMLVGTNHNILEMKKYLFNNLNKNLFLENIFV